MKNAKRFFEIENTGLKYLLDNRDGHIKQAERDFIILDVSAYDPDELAEMPEEELFTRSYDDITLHKATDLI